MRAVGVSGLLLLAACHDVLGLDTLALPDAPIDARVCRHGDAFSPGTPVPIDGEYRVEAARFDADRRHAYLALCPPDIKSALGCDLYESKFDELGGLSQHDRLGMVSSAFYDSYPTLTPSGEFLIFSSNRSGTNRNLVAMKGNGSFETPVFTELALAPGELAANEPYILDDGQTLYFSANQTTPDVDWDLYRATGGPPTFGPATRVPGLESITDEYAPVVSSDELEIFFGSNQHQGNGTIDIFTATRATAEESFSGISQVLNLSADGPNDWPVWLSPDLCSLYYISRAGADSTLYVATR